MVLQQSSVGKGIGIQAIKSCEKSYLYVVITDGITTKLCGKSLHWHTITGI